MIEFAGIALGTPFQGGALLTLLAIFGLALRSYVVGMPARAKVAQEREANLLQERAEEMAGMRERLETIEGKLEAKDRALETQNKTMDAERTMYRHRISNLGQAFHALLLLLKKNVPVDEAVEEVEKLRKEQLDREIAEAATFRAAGLHIDLADPSKSAAVNIADGAVADAEQTLRSTRATRAEVKHSEEDRP